MSANTDWTERYRPDTLDDVVGNEDIINQLKNMVESGDVQSCIFAGPAGIGKTTSAIALAKDFHGDQWQENFKELNASDTRGIDVVRDEIKEYTRSARSRKAIIFLDEADALTSDAQSALRRVMERHSSTCAFILSCNYPSKIIPAIQSRCRLNRFALVDDDAIRERLEYIIRNEGMNIPDDAVDVILRDANGDVRSAIKTLQAVSVLDEPITAEDIEALTFNVPTEKIKGILQAASDGDFLESLELLDEAINQFAIAPDEIIDEFYDISWEVGLGDHQRMIMVQALGEAEYRINVGCDSYIQLSAVLARVAQLPNN